MGQKTHPTGLRLGIVKNWSSRWYASKEMPALLKEDELIRKYLKQRLGHAAIAAVDIERRSGKVTVTVHTGRPGVVIGKRRSSGRSCPRSSSPRTLRTSWSSASRSAAP